MTYINLSLIEECLDELSSQERQLELWTSSGEPEVSSFREVLEQLFTDSGLESLLRAGTTGLDLNIEKLLIKLEDAMLAVDVRKYPVALIQSPEMQKVRDIAGEALIAIRKR